MRKRQRWWTTRIPDAATVFGYRALAPLRPLLGHHRLWQFNRRTVAGGLAVGLFFSVAVPVAQVPLAALLAVMLKVNLPLAIAGTLLSNPITTPGILFLALQLGAFILGYDRATLQWPDAAAAADPGILAAVQTWLSASAEWVSAAGAPLAAGLGTLSVALGLSGYVAVIVAWRISAALRWRRRAGRNLGRRGHSR